MTSTAIDRIRGANLSLGVKAPCRAATTANITLSGEQTIDGVAVVDGDRVLVKDQTTGSQNGIYIADTGTWERAPDFSGNRDVVTGTAVYVYSGTTNSNTWWRVSTTGTITIDTTTITISAGLANDLASMIFIQTGTGAINRTALDKMREIRNVLDLYGLTIL